MSNTNKIQNEASKNLRAILVAKKMSLYQLTKAINKSGYKVSHPTVGNWIAFPLSMNYKQSPYLAKAMDIEPEMMNTILAGEKIVVESIVTVEKK